MFRVGTLQAQGTRRVPGFVKGKALSSVRNRKMIKVTREVEKEED